MNKSFYDWYLQEGIEDPSLVDAYEAGQQSKQTEIDNLQKRIDDALEKCKTGIRKQGGDYYLELVEGILKGGTNE